MVSHDASIDWLCMPYFDSPSVCGRVLDEGRGGYFKITGINATKISQEYVRHTAIIKTRIETADGIFDIYDYMPRFILRNNHYYCPAEIHRNIRVVAGHPKIKVELKLKPNYATAGALAKRENEHIKFITESGEYHSYYLYTDLNFDAVLDGHEITLPPSSYLVLAYHEKIRPFNADRNYTEFERTKGYWLGWVYATQTPSAYREMIIRSMITLKLLMYQRSGAVIAAPTTSLPEIIGEKRNWDYRYCWIRDASMIIELFSRVGHDRSGYRYIQFILNQMLLKHDNIAVVYGINGEKVIPERTLDHLSGYENSRPVRIGNDAYKQTQNDVYGDLLEAIYTYFAYHHKGGFHFDQELWTVVRGLANHSMQVWDKPDNGIWEYRGQTQHHVFSKMMNWVAMDRAGRIAKMIGKDNYATSCFKKADEIKKDILAKGWNPECKAFTMYYGSADADAAVLLMPHYGFLPADDERMKSTINFCYEKLMRDGFAMRYTHDDGFGKPENAFVICTFWMINSLYLIGRKEEARELFDNVLTSANHLGLFAEGYDPRQKRQTGNFPQGYSHMAFIQTALLFATDYHWGPAEIS